MLSQTQFVQAFQRAEAHSNTEGYRDGVAHTQYVKNYTSTYSVGQPFDVTWTYGSGANAFSSPGNARNQERKARAWVDSPAVATMIQSVATLSTQTQNTGPLIQAITMTGLFSALKQAGVGDWFGLRIVGMLFPEHFTTICTSSQLSKAKEIFGIHKMTADLNASAQMLGQVDGYLQQQNIAVPNDFFRAMIAYFV